MVNSHRDIFCKIAFAQQIFRALVKKIQVLRTCFLAVCYSLRIQSSIASAAPVLCRNLNSTVNRTVHFFIISALISECTVLLIEIIQKAPNSTLNRTVRLIEI